MIDALPIGTPVTVRRASGEAVQGIVATEPLPWLAHIGEFYLVAKDGPVWVEVKAKRSHGMERAPILDGGIGMYSRGDD